jgi:uncharacterized protein YgiB involved in biofilm formation
MPRILMPRIFQTLMLCGAVSVIGTLPAAARDYPFCIKGCDFGSGRGDCSYSSYQQCQASASGRDAWCAENPYFNARAELLPDRSRQSKRRF